MMLGGELLVGVTSCLLAFDLIYISDSCFFGIAFGWSAGYAGMSSTLYLDAEQN